MNFAAPFMLWTLPLVAVPIIIHLLKRQRQQRIDFGAMEFLRRALRRTRRRVLLEDVLLLMLRTAAVLLLILALARPSTEALPLPGARAQRSEVVVLDASLSMQHLDGGQSAWDRGRALARKRFRDLDGAGGDRAALIIAGLQAERVAAGDPAEVRAVLEEAEQAGSGLAAMENALQIASATADSLPGSEQRSVRITIVSDLQASAWPLDGAWLNALAEMRDKGHEVQLVDCGSGDRSNLSVDSLDLSTPVLILGDGCEVVGLIRNHGLVPATTSASLLLDGDVVARESFTIAAGGEESWNVALSPVGLGARAVEMRLEHDSLVEDDSRAAILTVKETLQVMVIGDFAPSGRPDGVFDAVMRYLDLGEQAPLRAAIAAPERVDARLLEEVDVLLLADPGSLSHSASSAIADYCALGGGLLVLCGPQTGGKELAPLWTALERPGLQVGAPVHTTGEYARLQILDPEHPALTFFTDPRWQPLLTEVPFARYRPLRVEEGAQGLRVPLGFIEEDASVDAGGALAMWQQSGGRAAILTAAPISAWNRMEEVPGGTLPLLFDLLFHLAPQPGYPTASAIGAPLVVTLPRPTVDSELLDPQGLRYSTFAGSEVLDGGRTRLTLLERAQRPGVWEFHTQMLMADGGEIGESLRFAVVPPAEESDLQPLPEAELAAVLPTGVLLATAADADAGSALGEDTLRSLTRLLLQLLLAALVAETLLAAWLDRRRGVR